MSSVFKVYGITGDAKEWFAQHYFGTVQWEFDEAMSCCRCGDVYLTAYEDSASFEDTSEADEPVLNSWTDVAAYTDKNLF